MKIFFLLFLLVIIEMSAGHVNAQPEDKSPIVQFLIKRGYTFPDSIRQSSLPDSLQKWPDTVFYNTVYKARLLGSPTIPFSFSRIEYVNGNYQVTPTLSIGYGYTWFTGDFILNENDKITVDPGFFFGLVSDIAVQNNFQLNKLTGWFAGGFIGFSSFSLFFGYDFISTSAAIGIGGRIDLYTIRQIALHPVGRVREERKHKHIAVPVENE